MELIKKNNLEFDINLSIGENTIFINYYLSYSESIATLNEVLYYLCERDDSANMSNNKDIVKFVKNKEKLITAKEELLMDFQKRFREDASNLCRGNYICRACKFVCS